MRLSCLSALALLCSVPAAQADVSWQGDAVIQNASSPCNTEITAGAAAGRVLKTVLRPKDVSDNGVNTSVSFIANQTTVFAMVLANGAMPAGTAAVFGNTSSGVLKANVGIIYSNFVQTPTAIVLDTPDATLNGTINNFLFVPGCTVNFRAAYSKRND